MKEWTKESALALLSGGYWFRTLPDALQREIVARADIVRALAGSTLYRIGDKVDGLYALLDGDVRAHLYGDNGERMLFHAHGPKAWFGDFHLLDDYPVRTYEMVAASDSVLLFLSAANHRAITEASLENYKFFVALMCIHTRNATRTIVEQRSDAAKRTVRALLRLARAHGHPAERGVELRMSLSQSDLASLVGVSRQYLNGLLARWQRDGLIAWAGREWPLLDIERLEAQLSPLDEWMREPETRLAVNC